MERVYSFKLIFSYYIDFSLLKTKIRDLKRLQKSGEPQCFKKPDEEIEEEYIKLTKSIDKKLLDHLNHQLEHKDEESIKKLKRVFISIGKYVDEFLNGLDNEIQKFNKFYCELEKEIKQDFLFLKKEMSSLTYLDHVHEVVEFTDHLENSVTKVFSVCQYVNMNITAVRKILKKFDKKFCTKENPIALHYMKDNLTKKNSSLIYILQFKTIDEASALMDRMTQSLDKSIFRRFATGKKYKDEFLNEPLLLKEINLDDLTGHDIYNNVSKVLKNKIDKIKDKIERIDDANNSIRSGLEVWSLMVKSNIRVVDDYFARRRATLRNTNPDHIKEMLVKNISPDLIKVEEEEEELTPQMKMNLFIALAHTFLYTMNCYVVQLTNGLYCSDLGANKTYSGLIMGLTHFSAIFCTFIYSSWTNTSYKNPLILSCALFVLGNLTYSIADHFKSLILLGAGRFLIGLASARVVNRRFIIDQIPENLITHYSFLYVGLTCLGMSSGIIYYNFLRSNHCLSIDEHITRTI